MAVGLRVIHENNGGPLVALISPADLRRQGPFIVHGQIGVFPDLPLLRSAVIGRPELITRRSNVTVLSNGRSKIPRPKPGRRCR